MIMNSTLKALDSVLVRFADDPALWHQRDLLHHVAGTRWVVCSPDRDVFCMSVNSPPLLGVAKITGGVLPRVSLAG